MLSGQVKRLQEDKLNPELALARESKKQKIVNPTNPRQRAAAVAEASGLSTALRVRESALFRPVRAVGAVTDGVPFASLTTGGKDFIVTSIGRQFLWFNCEGLQVGFISSRFNEKIRALLCVNDVLLVTLKTDIVAWAKSTELGRLRGHTKPPTVLCSVGAGLLVSSSMEETLVWKLSDLGLKKDSPEGSAAEKKTSEKFVMVASGRLEHSADFGYCTAACHPPTYLHKVLLGGSKGGLALWNLRTLERIHTFRSPSAHAKRGGAITVLREAPNVLDRVAVGYATGRICILNAREDEVVLELEQSQGSISALSFRTGADARAHLVSASPAGACVVWDLEKRRAHHVMEEAHSAAVVSAHFLPGEPLLVTSGRDNAIRMWIFDTADGLPRLLRSRIGCPGVPRCMHFYGTTGPSETQIIAAGATGGGVDAVGNGFVAKVSLIRPQLNMEFSQGNLLKIPSAARSSRNRRLPPVIDMAVCVVRHYDWPALITAHEHMDAAVVWSAFNQALAPAYLKPPSEADWSPITAVAISACGNYCVVGMESGGLHRFNLQSQMHRGSFPLPPKPDASDRGAKAKTKAMAKMPSPTAHLGRICGTSITVSGHVISVAAHPEDSALRLWRLATHEAIGEVELGSTRPGSPSPLLLRVHGSLCAVSLDDGCCLVVDTHGMAVVRTFECGAPAIAMAFSPDGRWLATALRGGVLRVFDLIAARCVDSFVFPRPAVAVCFSPNTAHLLTAHSKGQPIQVWANKFLFDPSLSAPLLRPEPTHPINLDEPGEPEEDGELDVEEANEATEAESKAPMQASTVPLSQHLLTLSDVPPAKWLATLHLDLVKERNKPIEAAKPLPNAPFFLPTAYDGVTPRFAAPMGETEDKQELGTEEPSAALRNRLLEGATGLQATLPFQALLRKQDYEECLSFLRSQTASGVHLALEELGPMASGDISELAAALDFFAHHLRKAHFADEVQAFLTIFLQVHGEDLTATEDLRLKCCELCELQEHLWVPLDAQCQKAKCFLGTLTHTQSQW